MRYEPVLEVTRGEVVESLHYGAVAVANTAGELIAWWGDPETVTYLRSSAKPFQALPLVESGAAEHYGLTPRELSVVCASHSGTDDHMEVVVGLQRKVGVDEGDLACGVHPPLDSETAQRLKAEGLAPTPNRHNCSGKHTAMLALARFLEAPLEEYTDPRHPVQTRILRTFAEMSGLEPAEVRVGIDGCSAPNFAIPLRAAATAYARLADPSGLPAPRAEACQRIFAAMTEHPTMVAGRGRFDTRLMEVTRGRLVAKAGAEGYQAIGLPPGAHGSDGPGLGVVVKIADGNRSRRAGSPVALAVLEMLGVLEAGELGRLADFGPQPLTNYQGLTVGHTRTCFQLEWAT
jgi:L-asparaginase II